MRNKDRIEPLIRCLSLYWKFESDTRFMQLVQNIECEVAELHGLNDCFYVEDDILMEHIKNKMKVKIKTNIDKILKQGGYAFVEYLDSYGEANVIAIENDDKVYVCDEFKLHINGFKTKIENIIQIY